MLPHVHEDGNSFFLHPSCSASPTEAGKEKKRLGWQHSTRNRLALSSSLSHIMQIASLLTLLLYWHYWRLRELQNIHLFHIQKLLENCSFIYAVALHVCCTLGFQWQNQNWKYTQGLGTSWVYRVIKWCCLIFLSSFQNPKTVLYLLDSDWAHVLSELFLTTILVPFKISS